MINCKDFYNHLLENNLSFFTGVPDSLLKDFCAYITDNASKENHIITANEGSSIAMCAGYHLATNKIGISYMQNSGLGNAINPLSSLMAPEVYSIPTLLLIGWRGEPGVKDEPQHIKKGKMTIGLLENMEIEYSVLPTNIEEMAKALKTATKYMIENKAPYAFVIKKGTFEKYSLQNNILPKEDQLPREEAIKAIVDILDTENSIYFSNTGKISRELYEYRMCTPDAKGKDFLNVGSMGHTSQIAIGAALSAQDKEVYCLDGDGSVIMHMGGLTSAGSLGVKNFKHIILNNAAHDSVGGQPTVGQEISFSEIAKGCNYKNVFVAKNKSELIPMLKKFRDCKGPALIDLYVQKGAREDLGRPTSTPIENKLQFMENFSE